VLGGRAAPLAAIVRSPDAVRLTLVGREDEAAVRAALPELWTAAAAAGLVPATAGALPEPTIVRAGAALDFDTHAGKRVLLIGEAGGFAAGFSAETVYPAMLSGWIAAEVAGRALAAERAQEALAEFGLEWRARLADYLRSPNADLSLLLPLVFRNEQIARRVARAFLLGVEF
jgi:flavin-dependent dehydrogenase